MLKSNYKKCVYEVEGEKIRQSPKELFNSKKVYLIIDKDIKKIWIWAGKNSRLFHRYIASTWAGKLKSRKKFYNFKNQVVKEGREPGEFILILNEIEEEREDLTYPGESRKEWKEEQSINRNSFNQKRLNNNNKIMNAGKDLTEHEKNQIKKDLAEIKEMHMHIKYSIDHIVNRIKKIEEIIHN